MDEPRSKGYRRGPRVSDDPKPEGGLFPTAQGEGVVEARATAQATVKPATGGVTLIRSRYPGRIIFTAPSGKRYEWGQAGDAIAVSDEDVAFILARNKPGPSGCCGGGERIVFETD